MRRFDWLLLLVVGLLTSAWCLTAARQNGPTFDEPFYLEAGLTYWRTGKPGDLLRAGTMPLAVHLQTLPLYLGERLTGRPWVWPDDAAGMLVAARSVTLVFWWLLLLYTLRLGHALGGPWAGRLAVLLVALEPSFLAHASLATTDLALTACLLVFAYHFRAGRECGWGLRVGLPMVLFAVAMLAKASTLTFGPLVMFAVELERLGRNGALAEAWQGTWRERLAAFWTAAWPGFKDGLVIGLGGLALAVAYCGSDWAPLQQRPNDVAASWIRALPVWPNGLSAILVQIKHNLLGHHTYLIGYESPRWLWFYYPVLLTIKIPAVVLLLLVVVLLAPGPRLNLGLGVAGLLFLFSFQMHVQLGVRFVLPLLAFLSIGIAARVVALLDAVPVRWSPFGTALVAASLAWLLVGDLRLWPDSLRYTNELWGGTENGYRLVCDSNYDWGQGLPELAAWHERHSVPLALWYFGTDPRYPEFPRYSPQRDGLDAPVLRGRYLAVGTTCLYSGYTVAPPDRELAARLRQQKPVARTRTFLIFEGPTP